MFEDLKERGFFQQCTHTEELAKRLNEDRICCYVGFDPSGDSLHVGHLIPLMGLAHMQRSGHRIIALMGGGTAMIGDPSGKTEMRKMLTEEQLQSNIEGMLPQFERFLDFSADAILINNVEWLRNLNYIDFLRDIGRHFSVNRMLSFETYKIRLESGLSFLEFNYQLLQAYDFLELNRRYGCSLQMGGDDQWANIISGTDLIRRVERKEAYGWTYPLLTTSSGKKMGKTEKGAIWLNKKMLSPYDYWQFWRNTDDKDVINFLKIFTDIDLKQIESLKNSNQDINKLKVLLANETTAMLHGSKAAKDSELTAQKTFGDKSMGKNLPIIKIKKNIISSGINILDLVLQTKLGNSKSEIRRMIKNNGLKINNEIITDEAKIIDLNNFDQDNNLKVSHGKKQHVIVKII